MLACSNPRDAAGEAERRGWLVSDMSAGAAFRGLTAEQIRREGKESGGV